MRPRYDRPAYLCAPVRTPIGKFGGALLGSTAADLGTHATKACLERAGLDPACVDITIMGNARQAGVGPNVARQIAHRAGVRYLHRPANLEDLFIKLTGRDLRD